jgi:transposase-like protein
MKFKNLSKKEKEEFLDLYLNNKVKQKDKIEEVCKKFEISERTIFRWASKLYKE